VRELSADERAELARRVERHGLLDAVAYHRRVTGSSLAEAVAFVRASWAEGRPPAEARQGQGLGADVLAIGPFRADLVPFLEYDRGLWSNVAPGAFIVQKLFDVYDDDAEVAAVAAAFGIDPWDFDAHELDDSRVDLEALRALDSSELVERFVALRGAGFRFYFHLRRPGGADEDG
jgi:hypothetical protein